MCFCLELGISQSDLIVLGDMFVFIVAALLVLLGWSDGGSL